MDAASKKFILHNKIIWSEKKKFRNSNSEILCEFNGMHSAIIAYSYLTNLLSNKYQAKIVAFSEPSRSWLRIILYKLISPKLERIYKSFNTSKFILISLSKKQREDAELIFNDVYHNLKNKKDVLDAKFTLPKTRELGAIEQLNILMSYKENSLHSKCIFKVKKLEYTGTGVEVTVKIIEEDLVYSADSLIAYGSFNQEIVKTKMSKVLDLVKTRTLI